MPPAPLLPLLLAALAASGLALPLHPGARPSAARSPTDAGHWAPVSIPHRIVSTSKTKMNLSASWYDLNPGFSFEHFDDAELEAYVRQHRPSLFRHFPQMRGVEKADVFRYLTLYVHGGVYADQDTRCTVPVVRWPAEFGYREGLSNLTLIVGVEFERDSAALNLPMQLVQWTMASAPGHPLLDLVLTHCEEHISQSADGSWMGVMVRTGPPIWTQTILDAVSRFGHPPGYAASGGSRGPLPRAVLPPDPLRRRGQRLPLTFDGVTWPGLLLPYRAFGFCTAHTVTPLTLRNHLVEHMFVGSWKH